MRLLFTRIIHPKQKKWGSPGSPSSQISPNDVFYYSSVLSVLLPCRIYVHTASEYCTFPQRTRITTVAIQPISAPSQPHSTSDLPLRNALKSGFVALCGHLYSLVNFHSTYPDYFLYTHVSKVRKHLILLALRCFTHLFNCAFTQCRAI